MRPVTLIWLVAAGSGCTPAPPALTEAQQRALADSATTLVKAVVAHFDSLNIAAVFKDYSADPDARYLFNGALYPSLAAYRKDQEALGGSLEYAHTTGDAWDAMVLGPDAVMLTVPWHSDMKAKGRREYRVQGVWSVLVQRRNGRWQIVHSHESLLNPDQAMAALAPAPVAAPARMRAVPRH